MIIAERLLALKHDGQKLEVPIRIHAPLKERAEWRCHFEIGWPNETAKRWGAGTDAVQALFIAMQMIGAEIYASRYHALAQLSWLAPGHGYGFPASNNIHSRFARRRR